MTILQHKKVSVVIPNYNYARYLRKRIKSILKQTYPIYELIILDDCSSDDSIKIIKDEIEKIKIRFPRIKIKFIENSVNSGKPIAQWKKAFSEASGDYVWIAEADDLSDSNFLSDVMKGFDDPDVVLSYSESMIINRIGMMITPNFKWSRDREKTGHFKNSYSKEGNDEIREIMAIRCTIPNVSAVVFKKDPKIPFLSYLDQSLNFLQVGDWFFYASVLKHGKIHYVSKSLNRFRVHYDSTTGKSKKNRKHFDEVVAMHKMFDEQFALKENVKVAMRNEEQRLKNKYGIIEK